MHDAERWAIAEPSELAWREWEGEIVLYDCRAGDVHRLEGVAAELFDTLLAGPADLESLIAQVSTALAIERSAELAGAIESAVRDLHVSGVLRPVWRA